MLDRSADRSSGAVDSALAADATTRDTLTGFAIGLLSLLTSPSSIALNRAAMQSSELSALLLASGRHRVGPLVERFLAARHDAGEIDTPDTAAAFETLYGLVIRDVQIRVLLGEDAPSARAIKQQATVAVDQFLTLFAGD